MKVESLKVGSVAPEPVARALTSLKVVQEEQIVIANCEDSQAGSTGRDGDAAAFDNVVLRFVDTFDADLICKRSTNTGRLDFSQNIAANHVRRTVEMCTKLDVRTQACLRLAKTCQKPET